MQLFSNPISNLFYKYHGKNRYVNKNTILKDLLAARVFEEGRVKAGK